LPEIFTRKEACRYLDGFFTPNTLRNIDHLGHGAKSEAKSGKKGIIPDVLSSDKKAN
jgi:hypothetical protein